MKGFFGCFGIDADEEESIAIAKHAESVLPNARTVHCESREAGNRKASWVRSDGLYTASIDGLLVSVGPDAIWNGKCLRKQARFEALRQIVDKYRLARHAVLDDLGGAFVLAILDPFNKTALLAVDRMGIERMTYAVRSDSIIFSSSAYALASSAKFGQSVRNQALYEFLIFHMVPGPDTVFAGVGKLQPATALSFKDGSKETHRYWYPNYAYKSRSDVRELKGELHRRIRDAIVAAGVGRSTGAFLSGGLDSSSIAGTMATISGEPAKTFTVGFGETDYDELYFARLANERFGCEAYEYQMEPRDIVSGFPRIAEAYDEPFGNSSAVPTYFCAKLAADSGVDHLLAGDGGDELFAGNERYVRHKIFELYKKVPIWIQKILLEPVSRTVPPNSGITPLRKFRSYIDQARIPLPERFESWNLTYREGQSGMLDPEFAADIDSESPFRTMQAVWDASPSDDMLETMLWYDWHFTLADNDLRKVGTMCDLAGVRVSYPLLDDPVVSLSTSVLPELKIEGRHLRSFYRNAMIGFLPDEIINKTKHGFGLPFGLWLRTDDTLRDLIYSHLGDLKRRNIIATKFIDELIRQHKIGDASYYGYALWDFAMLEAWLCSHSN